MNTKWGKALIVSLVGIVILVSGSLVVDCIQYHVGSVFLKFLENQPPQIEQTHKLLIQFVKPECEFERE